MNQTHVINTENIRKEFLEKAVTRHDVYARQIPNGNYYPVHEPLTPEVYNDESVTVGFYCLNSSNKCNSACVDIDVNKEAMSDGLTDELKDLLKQQTRQISGVLKKHGIIHFVEFSGRKGYHIWILFDSPVQAKLIRTWMTNLEKEFELIDGCLHWELFPKQDTVSDGKYGNLIKLPLQKHQVSGERSHFVDEDFNEIIPEQLPSNPIGILDLPAVDSVEVKVAKQTPAEPTPSYPPFNMERMKKSCNVINGMIEKAERGQNIVNDERVWLTKLLKPYGKNGIEEIHKILSQTKGYDSRKTDFYIGSVNEKMATCEYMCPNGKCEAAKAAMFESPIGFGYQSEPGSIELKRGRYIRRVQSKDKNKWVDKVISEFVIEPHELIHLPDGDVLNCSIIPTSGVRHDNIHLDATAFQSKAKLLNAISRIDATFHGNDADVQNIAHYITQRVPKRSKGIEYVGLHGGTFVAEGVNITKDAISYSPDIKVVMKGDQSLAKRVNLSRQVTDEEYSKMLEGLYTHLPNMNKTEIIYPFIGWLMMLPLKMKIIKQRGGFFILMVYGEQGKGKTTTMEMGLRMYGYLDETVHDCRMTSFAMLSLLASTNGLPVVLDEYKESTMVAWQAQLIKDRIRGLYRGSLEPRGHADQSVTNYKLQAPVALSGEYKITEPAIMERVVFAPFDSRANGTGTEDYREHYQALRQLDLGSFAPRYIRWALGQDLEKHFSEAEVYLSDNEFYTEVTSRVKENWLALYVGLSLWKQFGESHGITVPEIPYEDIFKSQAEELGLGKDTIPLRDVDRLVEYMAIMAEKYQIASGKEWAKKDGQVLISAKLMLAGKSGVLRTVIPEVLVHRFR